MGYSLRRRTPLKRSWFRPKAKFGNVRSGGYDSKLEAAVFKILEIREYTGEIENVKAQQTVELTAAKIRYRIDFSFEKKGKLWYCEAKGVESERWKICKKLWKHYASAPLEIWMGSYTNPSLKEIITPL